MDIARSLEGTRDDTAIVQNRVGDCGIVNSEVVQGAFVDRSFLQGDGGERGVPELDSFWDIHFFVVFVVIVGVESCGGLG
jgi:hypothetical protein